MKRSKKAALGILAAVLLAAVLWLLIEKPIGVSKAKLEPDARADQRVPEDWHMKGDTGDHLAGMIFYSDDLQDHIFSVYAKNGGLTFGYFFRAGGSAGSVADRIAVYEEGGERLYLSMNAQKAYKAVYNDGWVEPLPEDMPFALVVPEENGPVTFYDADGEIVECVPLS